MKGADGHLKLIDFGLAYSNQTPNSKMSDIVGTPYYVAPEVLKGKYGLKCDMWSLGVVLYVMLSGFLPFRGDTKDDVYKKVIRGDYSLSEKEWKKVSDNAKDLLKRLLEVNPQKRISAKEALNHPWFKT